MSIVVPFVTAFDAFRFHFSPYGAHVRFQTRWPLGTSPNDARVVVFYTDRSPLGAMVRNVVRQVLLRFFMIMSGVVTAVACPGPRI